MEKISYEKLSQLQKLILVALLDTGYAAMKRREFNRLIKRLYYGKDSRAATSSLSRALQRLEERQYILRFGRRWRLTDPNDTKANPGDNGMVFALQVWFQKRKFYALLGLKGPPLEALGIEPAETRSDTERNGVEVELVGLD